MVRVDGHSVGILGLIEPLPLCKQVPDTETKLVIGEDGRSIDESNVTFVLNPFDEFALEEANLALDRLRAGQIEGAAVLNILASRAR